MGLKGQDTPQKQDESQQRLGWGGRTPGSEPVLPQFPLQPFPCHGDSSYNFPDDKPLPPEWHLRPGGRQLKWALPRRSQTPSKGFAWQLQPRHLLICNAHKVKPKRRKKQSCSFMRHTDPLWEGLGGAAAVAGSGAAWAV